MARGEEDVHLGDGARDEEVLAAAGDLLRDRDDLRGGLTRAEDDFGEPTAQRAMVVHLGEAQVLVGQALQPLGRLLERHASVADRPQQRFDVPGIHCKSGCPVDAGRTCDR